MTRDDARIAERELLGADVTRGATGARAATADAREDIVGGGVGGKARGERHVDAEREEGGEKPTRGGAAGGCERGSRRGEKPAPITRSPKAVSRSAGDFSRRSPGPAAARASLFPFADPDSIDRVSINKQQSRVTHAF